MWEGQYLCCCHESALQSPSKQDLSSYWGETSQPATQLLHDVGELRSLQEQLLPGTYKVLAVALA